jgi:hypothetical protein
MRDLISSMSPETARSRPLAAAMMLPVVLALLGTQISSALSARAATQAAIDAVTLARPHVPTAHAEPAIVGIVLVDE